MTPSGGIALGVCLGVIVLSFVLGTAALCWYARTEGLRSFFLFRPCRLLSKETLVEAAPGRLAVRRFRFALPGGAKDFGVDFTRGECVKVRVPGLLPLSRSYSPVAARPGGFDLIVKIYPVDGPGRKRVGASSHLDTLKEGDSAYVSGPYPPPLKHMARSPGRRVGIVAYGVGITESLAVAAAELGRSEVVLLWALRDQSEVFAQAELSELQARGLRLHHHFSREAGECLGPAKLREIFPWADAPQDCRFLVVGTKAMKKATRKMIPEAGLEYLPLLKNKFGLRPRQSNADETCKEVA